MKGNSHLVCLDGGSLVDEKNPKRSEDGERGSARKKEKLEGALARRALNRRKIERRSQSGKGRSRWGQG